MMVGSPTSLLITPTNSISPCLLIPNETRKIQPHLSYVSNSHLALRFKNKYFFSSPLQFRLTHFSFRSLLEKRDDILCLYAIKKPSESGTTLVEMSDFDDMDDEFDDFDDENEDYEDKDEDAGMLLPLEKMKKWLENKPRGFGEGKVYNTSIEDKLLEEMEQSRKAQAANVDNLKNNPVNSAPNKDIQNKKVPEVVPSGIRVRVVNLPKKKNIHRDLKSAFKEVTGVVNIIPAVSGNKKTKDPICKGFAFVDFKYEEDADRFVQQFSGQTVAFGRTQKQIKCMMPNSHSSNSSDDESAGSFYSGLNSNVPAVEDGTNAYFDTDDSSFEENSFDVPNDTDAELVTAKLNDVTDNMESFSISELNTDDTMEPTIEPTTGSFSSKKQDKNMGTKKKIIAKGRGEKVPKMEIPGSAKRLKIKEKAVLNDVFTKYGLKSPPSSREES